MRYEKLWILLADAEHARVVVPNAVAGGFRTATAFDSVVAHRTAADLGTDAPGRTYDRVGGARHAIVPRHDPHAVEEERFLQEIAGFLREAERAGNFQTLVLVAPGKVLHALRRLLDPAVRAKLVGSEGKDLLKVPDHSLPSHLATWAQHGTVTPSMWPR